MENNRNKSFMRAACDRLSFASDAFTRLYDRSVVAHTSHRIRRGFLTLSQRAVGVFFLTFGVYSFLIAALITLFTKYQVSYSNIYGGALIAVCSIPLLFSKGNVSAILTDSAFGSALCDVLNINKNTVSKKENTGHSSISFVLGVLLGAATVFIPFNRVIIGLCMLLIIGMILSAPETGLVFMTVLLFFADSEFHYCLISVMAVSYAFKLVRKKRKLSLNKTDVAFLILALSTLGGILFSSGGTRQEGSVLYFLLLSPYFTATLLLRETKKITKLLTVTVFSAGVFSALYILGEAVMFLPPNSVFVDTAYPSRLLSSLPALENGFAPVALTALIPVCTASVVHPGEKKRRFTFILCLISMSACLFISGDLAFLMCAYIAAALLLLITGSRRVYLTLATLLFFSVLLLFSGKFGDSILKYLYESIYEAYHQAESFRIFSQSSLSAEYVLYGQGFIEGISDTNLYLGLISRLGMAGFMVFISFLLFIITSAARLLLKAYAFCIPESSVSGREQSRIKGKRETRMGIISVVCSVVSLLLAATFYDFYKSSLSYLIFFLFLGICSAYARSASAELSKAEGYGIMQNSKERACAVIHRQHNQGGIK